MASGGSSIQAIRIERARIGRCRRIEHRPCDQRLEEVAVDIEGTAEDDLLEERLEVESRFVAVDVRVAVEGQDRADVRMLEFGPIRAARGGAWTCLEASCGDEGCVRIC